MSLMNRLAIATNSYQGSHKKVLTVCSAGILRSPTAAHILSSPPFNFNTRCAGVDSEFALIPVDRVLIEWADEIVCMERYHADCIERIMAKNHLDYKPLHILNIQDDYEYRSDQLCYTLVEQLRELYPVN